MHIKININKHRSKHVTQNKLNYNKSKIAENKLAPYGTDGRLFTTDVSARFKVT